uniref:flavonol 3-sulfotransferase-like n=1 Tax=Erigeron canadensis TaxID=72917 RepID=UPI001CB9B0C7|nr:flavonol 3-sulfotransferase-like [Erigeron canadensis]
MEEICNTLPQHTSGWSKERLTLYKYQGYWNVRELVEGAIMAQKTFKAKPNNLFLCSCPKTGTTWLKALAFSILTRETFNASNTTHPLLTTMPHDCVPFLEQDLKKIQDNQIKNSDALQLVATHLPYASLPQTILASNCKIVYIYRNVKDVIVSNFHFIKEAFKIPKEEASFEDALGEYCQGISLSGPYWDHILGYWRASMERPETVLFLKYEDMKSDTTSNVKRLAGFLGYPFSIQEENAGVVDNIVKLCSFENLSNLEVNKSGKHRSEEGYEIENRIFFRKAKDGDWENYFTYEMKEKIDKLVEEKMIGTGLVLK